MLTRRQLCKNVMFAGVLSAFGRRAFAGCLGSKKRILRFAHITDIHLDNRHNSEKGLTAAIQHIHSLADKPEMIISGGDQVWDLLGADEQSAAMQLSLFKKVIDKHCRIPIKYCLGNHEVWGWNKKKSKTTGNEKLWGKKRAVKKLNMPGRYYSFGADNWHIIILDSMIAETKNVYAAGLDDEQFSWLRSQLRANKDKHICIISHIPIFSAAALLRGKISDGSWCLNGKLMHFDSQRIRDLFNEYSNVRLCISGHSHLLERLEYGNIIYICEGAVCGRWWKGKNRQTEEGYGVFDLYDDGTFEHKYIDYGWEVEK